jgi:hypothetical protein
MSLWDQLKAALSGEKPSATDSPPVATATLTEAQASEIRAALEKYPNAILPTAQDSDEVARLKAENAELKKGKLEQRKATLKAEAESFINGKIKACEVLPSVKDGFIGAYVQAGLDDDAAPVAEGKPRVDMLKAQYEGRDKHALTGRTVKTPAGATVLAQDDDDPEVKADVEAAKAYAKQANGRKK